MQRKNYKSRVIDKKVDFYLSAFGAVCIEGPKWCGKTWTASQHCKSEISFADPYVDANFRQIAAIDPNSVLSGEKPHLIDEWQMVPSLWDAVRYRVDQTGEAGQFLLTGSATPTYKGINHSGAGRFGCLRMRPMSLWELGASSGDVSLKDICENLPIETRRIEQPGLQHLIELVMRGGWPANINKTFEQAIVLPNEYLTLALRNDIHQVDGIRRDSRKMNLLLRSLARNESTTVSVRTLMRDIKETDDEQLSVNTIGDYLDLLGRLFLTDNIPPFDPSLRSSVRVKEMEKRHLADPSLACALMGATADGLYRDLNAFGFLFEALVERDLRIYAESFDGKLYHYQDYKNCEIDAVITLPNNEWCAFEVKLGAHQIDEAAANLLKIKSYFANDTRGCAPKVLAVICGVCNAAYRRPDGVYVVPITALKP